MPYKPYVPQDIGELLDHVRSMMLGAPTFKDRTGYFPEESIDTTFFSLNEALQLLRKKLGEEQYATLRAKSDEMRALFESDPDDANGGTKAGRKIIREIERILTGSANHQPRK